MKFHNKIKTAEIALIAFVWLVMLLNPLLFAENNNNPLWKSVANQLEILVPLSIIFVVNRFFLVPFLLFRRKELLFILSVLGVILLLGGGIYYYNTNLKQSGKPKLQGANENRQPPPRPSEEADRSEPQQPQKQKRQPSPVPPYANFLVLAVLVVGFDTGLRSGLRWVEVENEKIHLEKENVANQLVMLRNQISPHFFMNTLNNIHSLVDDDTAEAKEAIIKLSKMMRYLLYETETEKTTLKKEVEFLESYIDLMKLRFSEKVSIILNLPVSIPDKTLPPFLFISLIENAFKHGISYKDESFIHIDLVVGDQRLLLVVKNSKTNKNPQTEHSGIGIENTRKRLALLFGNNFHLDIIDSETIFTVNLSIPL